MKTLDYPPLWLLGCLLIAYVAPRHLSELFWPGAVLLIAGAGLTGAALAAFARARTTVIPHRTPSDLITGGVFRFTRNPIYLADLLILAGFSLMWGSLVGWLLLPVLFYVLLVRFIQPEEARLTDAFGAVFTEYARGTRRWI